MAFVPDLRAFGGCCVMMTMTTSRVMTTGNRSYVSSTARAGWEALNVSFFGASPFFAERSSSGHHTSIVASARGNMSTSAIDLRENNDQKCRSLFMASTKHENGFGFV